MSAALDLSVHKVGIVVRSWLRETLSPPPKKDKKLFLFESLLLKRNIGFLIKSFSYNCFTVKIVLRRKKINANSFFYVYSNLNINLK